MAGKALESPVMQVSSATPLVVTIPDPVNIEFPGPALFWSFAGNSTPNILQTLINQTIGDALIRKLRRVEVISRAYAEFYVEVNGTSIKYGKTSPTESTVSLPFEPWKDILNTQNVKVKYLQTDGPVVPIEARLYYTSE
jgi:hypothetical protein